MGCAASIQEALKRNDLTVDRSHFYFAKVIGTGGFGTVMSAMHTEYHSWFAVKQINKVELMKHKSGLDMIMGELNAWKAVSHHHYVADLHFAFQDRSYCYFVMDLLTGADLRYYIKKRIILTEPELAFIVACMSSALQHIHSHGVLHRDVKPENIVFDHEGFPYLTDFGVSHVCDPIDMTCNLSSGTKQYLAPEIFGKSHVHGPESDFWSLGVMIFEIMYGRRPFEKHVPREFINYVEFEYEKSKQLSRSNRNSPIRTNSPLPTSASLSPYERTSGGGYSPYQMDTCMLSGAVSLSNTRTPPPTKRKMSPMPSPHSIVIACPASPSSSVVPPSELKQDEASDLKLPPLMGSKKGKVKSSKLPAIGSLAAATSLMELLRREEATRRSIAPENASKYTLPPDINFPTSTFNPDGVSLFNLSSLGCDRKDEETPTCPESDRPPRSQRMADLSIDVSDAENSKPSDTTAPFLPPPLPTSLKVSLPSTCMYHEPVTAEFKSFLEGILDIRPKHRLGGSNNYQALQEHEWFSKCRLSWRKIEDKSASPPFVPNREQIQFDMTAKHRDPPDELDGLREREFLSVEQQKLFQSYHHIASEYKELFPALYVHNGSPGTNTIKCSKILDKLSNVSGL